MGYLNKLKLIIINRVNKDKKMIMASLCGGLIITFAAGASTKAYSETIQKGIADSVIRFHVLANSDTTEDQELKLKVRDAVLTQMQPKLKDSKSIDETKIIINSLMMEIKEAALNVIKNEGYNYDVNVIMSRDLFPMKVYGDIAFPSGMYDAVRIEIGKAEGQNWWCVMFPPLCFVDVACDEVSYESKEELRHVLSEDEYNIVVKSRSEKEIVPEVKFKIVEWWQNKEATGSKYATKP